MIKCCRFMGKEEFEMLRSGKDLYNNTQWCKKAKSTSVGFCFAPIDNINDEHIYWDFMDSLYGVVDDYALVIFEVENKYLNKSKACYSWDGSYSEELCTTSYNSNNFKILKTYLNEDRIKNYKDKFSSWDNWKELR